ncbi:MAG: hypothetical protein IIY75_02225 [Erysipelotrichales bacterium]|nr:hypothetical protein [Erysipelotrichales bacterium]
MITVNSRFHTLIKTAGARTRARIYFIDNTVNCTNDTAVQTNGTLLKRNSTDTDSNGRIAESGLELYDLYNKEQNLTIGGSVSGQFKITFLNTDGGLNNFTYGRCKVYLDVYDEENSAWLSCPLGVFIIEQPVKSRIQLVEASGYDQMQYFDEIADPDWFSGLFSSAKTLNQIYSALVTQVSSVCGVTITPANTDMLNKTVSYSTAPFEPVEMTYREILNWIAEASGTIARFNRNGVLQLKWLANIGSEYAIGADALGCGVFSTDISEYECAVINKLQVKASESDYGSIIGTGENAYVITDNPFLYGSTSAQVTTRATPIYNRLHGFGAYTPLTVDLIADPSVEAGDIISVTRNGETYALPIFQQTLTWKGGYIRGSLQSSGTPNRLPVSAQNRYEFRSKKSVHELVVTTEELRSDITSVSDNLATNYPTTETMNSAIQQSAAAIDLSVSQRFDALSVGGTNFLLNSAFTDATTPYADHGLNKWNNNGSAQMITLASGITCAVMQIRQKDVSGGTQSVSQNFTPRVIDDAAETVYTVSGDFVVNGLDEGSNPSLVFIFNGYYDDNGTPTIMTPTYFSGSASLRDMPSNQWVRRTYTLKFPNKLSVANFLVYGREVDCNIYWKDLKVEHGNKATAWSPSPEDYATTGEAAALQAQITVNATNIESKVSQTDYTGATIASKINQSASTVEIEADHINLNGIVTTNSGFMIDQNGYMTANGATIGSSGTDGENVPVSVKIENGIITIYRNDVLAGRFGTGASYDGNTYRSGVSLTGSDGSAAELSTDRFVLHEKYGTDKYWRTLIDGGTFGIYNSNRAGNLNEIFFTASPTTVTPQGSITSVNGIETFGAIDATNSDVILTSNGDLSKTGTLSVVTNPSGGVSVSTATWADCLTVTLDPGVWMVYGFAQFPSNANGYRAIVLSRSSASSGALGYGAIARTGAASGAATDINATYIAKLTSSLTVHLLCYQNSGSTQSVYCGIQAIRIA